MRSTRPAAPTRSARPLVVRCGALGDMVLITTLIRALAARCGSEVDVLTSGPWSEPLLRGQPGVGDILSVRSRKMPFWLSLDQRRVVRRLRKRGAGPTWFCDGSEAAWSLLSRSGITTEFVVDVKNHPLRPGEHATEQWRRLAAVMPTRGAPTGAAWGVEPRHAAGIGDPPLTGGCYLKVGDRQAAECAAWWRTRGLPPAPFIAIQAGNKRTMRRGFKRLAVNHKYWPRERWAAVLKHVRMRCPQHSILLLGTGPEYHLNRALAAQAGIDRLYNVADDLDVPRLMAVLARADGLITVDSGPAHVAAGVGCPQVVLFGRASTTLYRPWSACGAEVTVLTGEIDGTPSMLGIEAARVTAGWDSLRLRSG